MMVLDFSKVKFLKIILMVVVAHKNANTIIPIYAIFLFLVSGDMSSSGVALGFLVDITKIKIAISQ